MYEALLPVVRTRQTKQKNTDTLTTTETNRKVRRTWGTQRSEDEDALSFRGLKACRNPIIPLSLNLILLTCTY